MKEQDNYQCWTLEDKDLPISIKMNKFLQYVASWLGTREDEIIKEITPMSEMREKIEDVKKNIERATREIGEGKSVSVQDTL